MEALVDTSLYDDDDEVRLACLDQVVHASIQAGGGPIRQGAEGQGQPDRQSGRRGAWAA